MKTGDVFDIVLNNGNKYTGRLDKIDDGKVWMSENYYHGSNGIFGHTKTKQYLLISEIISLIVTDKSSVAPSVKLSTIAVGQKFKYLTTEYTLIDNGAEVCKLKYVYVSASNGLFGSDKDFDVEIVQ